ARSQWLLGNVPAAARLLDRCAPDRRGWEWHYLRGLNHADLLTITDTAAPYVNAAAYGPDGTWLAVGGGNPFDAGQAGVVQVSDADTGRLRWRRAGPVPVWGVAVSPDGRLVASAGGPWRSDGPGELRVWDAATGELRHDLPGYAATTVVGVAFSPDGSRLAAAGYDRTARVWDVSAGTEVYRVAHGGRVGA